MIRTQIYLTEKEKAALKAIAQQTGKKQSALIREAIDRFITRFRPHNRRELLRQARGMWQGRDDLPDFPTLRRELDR
jgi:predicted transcriptional regulator